MAIKNHDTQKTPFTNPIISINMKTKILLLLLFISFKSFSQISVGPKHTGKAGKFKKGVLEKFKKTETIFVLSNIYEKELYEKILSASWNVTPYKIIQSEDFILEDYLSDNYSIADISGKIIVKDMKYGGTVSRLYTYIDFKLYDDKSISEERNKLSQKKWNRNKEKIMGKNTSKIARFYLYPKDDFADIAEPNPKGLNNVLSIKRTILDTPEYLSLIHI